MADRPPIVESAPMREIPSISLAVEQMKRTAHHPIPDDVLARIAKSMIEEARAEIARGARISRQEILRRIQRQLSLLAAPRLAPVINATGVLLHTNLGRAPVSAQTARAMATAAGHTVPLEIDPTTNERGARMSEVTMLMHALTGAEATLVVNNNAAAVLLVLSALCSGREVIVSRGEAVEVGGGFRIPDVLRQSGATIVEVGTTNRTYTRDYAAAITGHTAAILKVHQSNFRIEGFTALPELAELSAVAAEAGIPLIDDLGSGSILQTADFGLAHESTITESLAAGASIVTASGDKLLGGPQAGIITGTADLIATVERHPIARALRADKATLAGVAATLRHYLNGEALEHIPIWRMISATSDAIQSRATQARHHLQPAEQLTSVVQTTSTVGGGSLPGEAIPSWAIAFNVPDPDTVARRLRLGDPPVFGRIHNGQLLLDFRSILPESDPDLVRAVDQAVAATD